MSRNKNLEQHILALEMELHIIEQDIAALNIEIKLLSNLCQDLNDNLIILKQSHVVATIRSYQESKVYLESQTKLLNKNKATLEGLEKKLSSKDVELKELYKIHEKNYEEKESGKNVLVLPIKR